MADFVHPFKLETTHDNLTAHAGLALLAEFIDTAGLQSSIERHFPKPGSHNGYLAQDYIIPFMLMLHGGGRTLEDLRDLRNDPVLPTLINVPTIPSSDAAGDWLRRQGAGEGEQYLMNVHQDTIQQALLDQEHTLDLDASLIAANKQEAEYTYKGFKGYDPLIAHVDNYVASWLFRSGNASPRSDHVELIKQVEKTLPEGHRLHYYRSDSAGYQADAINYCEHSSETQTIRYAIAVSKDVSVKRAIKAIPDNAWRPFRDGEIAETTHSMEKTTQPFRLVVFRRLLSVPTGDEPEQLDLFKTSDDITDQRYRYHAIASNFKPEKTAEAIQLWYSKRADASENRIKELKIGFGMERMPCGQEEANAIFFALGCLAYNLFVYFKQVCFEPQQRNQQVQTVRWQFYNIAAKLTSHARHYYLKMKASACHQFEQIRQRYLTWGTSVAT